MLLSIHQPRETPNYKPGLCLVKVEPMSPRQVNGTKSQIHGLMNCFSSLDGIWTLAVTPTIGSGLGGGGGGLKKNTTKHSKWEECR